MKTIFQTLMRYKASTLLNVLGLSIAFAVVIICAMQLRYVHSYNTQYKDYGQLYQASLTQRYRLVPENKEGKKATEGEETEVSEEDFAYHQMFKVGRPFAEAYKNLPSVEAVGVVQRHAPAYLTYYVNGGERSTKCNYAISDDDFWPAIDFDIIDGDVENFNKSNYGIISDKFAKQLFGDESPIDKRLHFTGWGGDDGTMFYVGAVYKSVHSTGEIEEDVFLNTWGANLDVFWGSYDIYVRLKPNATLEDLKAQAAPVFNDLIKKTMPNQNTKFSAGFSNIVEVPYLTHALDKNIIYIFIAIALIIMFIGFINFVNFATSTIPLKIKNINLRRVVGATKGQLRLGIILADIVTIILAFAGGALLVEFIKILPISHLVNDTSFAPNIWAYILSLVAAIIMGTISGLYPAFYSTSFQPSLMLKGRLVLGGKGLIMRKLSIGFQYFIALTFITATIFVVRQHNLMLNRESGFIRDGIIKVDHISSEYKSFENYDGLRNQLMQNVAISDVTFGRTSLGIGDGGDGGDGISVQDSSGVSNSDDPNSTNKHVYYSTSAVHPNFLDFFGLKILEGDNLNEMDVNGALINKTMAKRVNLLVGDIIKNDMRVAGIYDDINLGDMRRPITPALFLLGTSPDAKRWNQKTKVYYDETYIKVSGSQDDIFNYISDTYEEFAPMLDIDVNYFDDVLANNYKTEANLKTLMQAISTLSIIIALIGIFGLMTFETRFRRKEISVRKINGSTILQVIKMFVISYLKIVIAAFVLSAPLVYYVIDNALMNYAYRIELSWWVFAIAFLLVTILTIGIAFIQCYKLASENPISSLKEE